MLDIHTFPITDVLEVLQWKSPGAIEANLWSIHEARLHAAFESMCRADHHGILGALYDSLPAASRTRFLTAPETAYRLLFSIHDVKFLLGALCAEARLLGDRSSLPQSLWTAAGDWYIPKGATAPSADERLGWAPDAAFRAPVLHNGAPIDMVSPYTRRLHKYTRVTTCIPFEVEDMRQAVATVREAMMGVTEVSAAGGRMVDRFVRTLVLERHLEEAMFTSYSLRWLIGRTGLQLTPARCGATEVANALVHESIHTALYIIGHTVPYLQNENTDDAHTIRSPWSGRELDPYSFAHAIFVWFGLWQFWRAAQGQDTPFPGDKVAERLHRARVGFEGTALEQALDANASVLAPHVITSTRAMLSEIRRGAFD